MKRFLKIVAVLIVAFIATDFIVEQALARGGGGRGGGRGGGGRGGGRGGRMGRGGRGGGEDVRTPKEAIKLLLEQRIADEREACMEEAREAGAAAGVDSMNDRVRREDRENEARARREDWRARANP